MDKSNNWVELRLPSEQQIKVPLALYESEIHRLEQLHEQDPDNQKIVDRLNEVNAKVDQLLQQRNPTPRRHQKAKEIKQDRVQDVSVIKDLLACMSSVDPPFIDPESARNYQEIYEGHFKDLHQLSSRLKVADTSI